MTTALVNAIPDKKGKYKFFEQIDECLVSKHQKPVWFQGNAADANSIIKKSSIDVIITSPPYWRRRDYEHPDQLGQEDNSLVYIHNTVSSSACRIFSL